MNFSRRPFRLLAVALLAATVALASLPPSNSQAQQAPSIKFAKTEEELKAVQGAFALLQKYNIPLTALDNLLPLISQPEKLQAALKGLGLSDDQVGSLLQEAVPLIQQGGLDPKSLQSYVADQSRKLLEENGIAPELIKEILEKGMTPDQIKAYIAEKGGSEEAGDKIAKGLTYYEALGLDQRTHANAIARDALALMEKYNIPPQALNELLPNITDPAAMVATLVKYGLSAEQAQQALSEAAPLIAEGLNANIPAQFIAEEALNTLMGKGGLSPEQAAEVLALREDAKAFGDSLLALGLDPKSAEDISAAFTLFEEIGIDPTALQAAIEIAEITPDELTALVDAIKSEEAIADEPPATEQESLNDDDNGGDNSSSGDATPDPSDDSGSDDSGSGDASQDATPSN